MEKNKKQIAEDYDTNFISRKEAIKKAGVTVLAATSLAFLTTNANAKASRTATKKTDTTPAHH